jgi:hypothetical protein
VAGAGEIWQPISVPEAELPVSTTVAGLRVPPSPAPPPQAHLHLQSAQSCPTHRPDTRARTDMPAHLLLTHTMTPSLTLGACTHESGLAHVAHSTHPACNTHTGPHSCSHSPAHLHSAFLALPTSTGPLAMAQGLSVQAPGGTGQGSDFSCSLTRLAPTPCPCL